MLLVRLGVVLWRRLCFMRFVVVVVGGGGGGGGGGGVLLFCR